MLLKYFYDKPLAQASYMVGCAATGEALVIDAGRNIQQYLDVAEAEGLTITHVTETHIHADYVSGSRELANATGARLYLSDEGDADWKYGFTDDNTILLKDGDMWMVGNVRVDVIHTPGHTLEHLSFMITDTAGAEKPMGIFTGDFLFAGNIGRPDLLDEAAGYEDTRFAGAKSQFENVQKFKEMPDYLQIWPGHGAGSACGKSLGAVPSTTLGYEKLFNPAFQIDDVDEFVDWLLEDQPEAPRYFAQMKKVNKEGPALLLTTPYPQAMSADDFAGLPDNAQIIDARSQADFALSHLPKALNVPSESSQFNTYVGWYVDYDQPLYLVAEGDRIESLVIELRNIGVDNTPGYFTPETIKGEMASLPLISPEDLNDRDDILIVDVRGATEYRSERIPGARNIPMGHLPRYFDDLPADRTLVTQCATGIRSQVAASLLQKHGFTVANLDGGLDAWRHAGMPVEQN